MAVATAFAVAPRAATAETALQSVAAGNAAAALTTVPMAIAMPTAQAAATAETPPKAVAAANAVAVLTTVTVATTLSAAQAAETAETPQAAVAATIAVAVLTNVVAMKAWRPPRPKWSLTRCGNGCRLAHLISYYAALCATSHNSNKT